MSAVIVAVHLPDNNGLPADDTVNTFCFQDVAPGTTPYALAEAVIPLLGEFYNTATGGGPLCSFLGDSLSRASNACTVVAYQLAATGSVVPVTPLGGPVTSSSITLGAATAGSDLPRECAAVLSFAGLHSGIAEDVPGGVPGPKGDTHPAARHRGRVYLGPLNISALGAGTNGPGIAAGMRNSMVAAGHTLGNSVTLLPGLTSSWCVWSRVNHALYPIINGWADDAFDTQRRRGIKATNRTTWTVA